ncbi:hypothetical protein IWW36_004965 [Coemansia brasiliensis]|uniref:Uncharacterized protein n=1 Tax=Coemansia brasiliensis TaxID=2650707 RepID=A0A9W8I9R1_9FUNG|nr:hypothetical protein IWW36_004965 [Coemansia brasiliensis]
MSSVAHPSPIRLAAACPDTKNGTSPVPLKRSSSTLAIRQPRRMSLLRLTPTKSPCSSPRLNSKKKPRLALQAIHVRALEHGLRVPVCNTPLGIVDQAENIAYSPAMSIPMTALPTSASFPRLDLLPQSTASVPPSPSRRTRLVRRNSMC